MCCRGSGSKRSTYPHIGRNIKRDKEGVASVVGTIMALLIFLTILTIFVNTWMPVTLKENERSHMDEVMNEMGSIKSSTDNMIIYSTLSGYSSTTVYQSIDLGAAGIPAFASATAGLLTVNPYSTGSTSRTYANFTVTENSIAKAKSLTGGGSIEFYAPNRYYVQQWVAYENGGIVLKQEDGQIMRATPGISFVLNSGALNMYLYQVTLLGTSSSVSGTETAGLNLQVMAATSDTYSTTAGTDLQFKFITEYGTAYYDYLNDTLSSISGIANGGASGWKYNNTNSFYYQNTAYTNTASVFWRVSYEYLSSSDCYAVTLTMHNAAGKVSNIFYNHAYVNVQITK